MDYFSESEGYYASQALPTPSDTPYATPVPSTSRRSSRFGTPSPLPSSPPSAPDSANATHDVSKDENISILDPRRFTPTLHANLVSEILSLRRELDSKHKFIEGLETNLQSAKTENDSLSHDISQRKKENRSLRSQIQQLENGTLSALEQLAKEKDETKSANEELKHKLDSTQKKVKTQEDDSNRMHREWEKEKEQWVRERGIYERRVHTTETRLRIVLDELAVLQVTQEARVESEVEDATMDSGLGNESDTASILSRSNSRNGSFSRLSKHGRTMSNSSYKSIGRQYRFSTTSTNGTEVGPKTNGMSLADELRFDEEDEDLDELELDSDDFPENEMRARRALESRQSTYQDEKAKRILGLTNDPKSPISDTAETDPSNSLDSGTLRPESRPESRIEFRSESRAGFRDDEEERLNSFDLAPSRDSRDTWHKYRGTPSTVYEVESVDITVTRPQYVDAEIQYSPPPSPALGSTVTKAPEDASVEEMNLNDAHEIEANQRRKRVSVTPSTASLKPATELNKEPAVMVSSSVQTSEQPLSPPATPKLEQPQQSLLPTLKIDTNSISISTQTEPVIFAESAADLAEPIQKRAAPPSPISVPSIVISPTLSAPSSPRQAVLPPNTRNIAVQASFISSVPTRSVSVQTDTIRLDARLAKLPPHLLPSAIRSKPGTPEPTDESNKMTRPGSKSGQDRSSDRKPLFPLTQGRASASVNHADVRTENRYPGNNDNGFIVQNKGEGIRRPFRSSSLFAGFTGGSSEDDEDRDADLSGEEGRVPARSTTPSGRGNKHGKSFGSPPTPVPEENEFSSRPNSEELTRSRSKGKSSPRTSLEQQSKVVKPLQRPFNSFRQPNMRRSALIQSGNAAHSQRSRSPSLGSTTSDGRVGTKPPFPVPQRSSSRRIVTSKSEGSQSPTHRPSAAHAGRINGYKKLAKQDSLRKVRSAAVIPRNRRSGSRSPPLVSERSDAFQIPPLPPMPADMITSPSYATSDRTIGHQTQESTNTVRTASASIGSSIQSTSVVDAIAATMVGEWMWKYMRKRKSFGVPESPHDLNNDSGNGARHKRWVWLSPYERSVMWSSKQPTSGTALLGKSGRKLVIQSVLDVPDNTPLAKGSTTQGLFNRSILILTPARALKFTATSKERHYLWLTALSFLASSGNGNHEVETSPVPPPVPMAAPPPRPPPSRPPPDIPIQTTGGPFKRGGIRDSVRLTKERNQPVASSGGGHAEPIPEHLPSRGDSSAASPPYISRLGHGRKRSSTGPRLPPPINTSFRSFSSNMAPQIQSAGLQSTTTTSSDYYGIPPSVPSSIYNPPSVVTSARPSEASVRGQPNLFDAMGTVRMEAFVANTTKPHDENGLMSTMWGNSNNRRSVGRHRGSTQWSTSTNEGLKLLAELGYDPNDPFKGF